MRSRNRRISLVMTLAAFALASNSNAKDGGSKSNHTPYYSIGASMWDSVGGPVFALGVVGKPLWGFIQDRSEIEYGLYSGVEPKTSDDHTFQMLSFNFLLLGIEIQGFHLGGGAGFGAVMDWSNWSFGDKWTNVYKAMVSWWSVGAGYRIGKIEFELRRQAGLRDFKDSFYVLQGNYYF